MPACGRFLCPECWTKGVGLAKSHGTRLLVQLTRLTQIRWLSKVFGLEQSGGSLTRIGRENGGVQQQVVALVEVVADGADTQVAYFENGMLLFGAHPQMPMVMQECRAMLFWADGIARYFLVNRHLCHLHLVAALGPIIGVDGAR